MRWNKVIVHHSASEDHGTLDYRSIRKFHTDPVPQGRGWRDIGYHAVVELTAGRYITIPGRSTEMIGAHCPEQNSQALGICLVGNFDIEAPPQQQLEEAADTIAGWCIRFGIPAHQIFRHRDFKSTACPGAQFPLVQLRSMVQHRITEG